MTVLEFPRKTLESYQIGDLVEFVYPSLNAGKKGIIFNKTKNRLQVISVDKQKFYCRREHSLRVNIPQDRLNHIRILK